jgi:hypothetical protein
MPVALRYPGSEAEPEFQLKYARLAEGTGYSKIRVARGDPPSGVIGREAGVDSPDLRMVEEIEYLAAHLQLRAFCDASRARVPLAVSVILMWALGMTAPVWSAIVPLMVCDCAISAGADRSNKRSGNVENASARTVL